MYRKSKYLAAGGALIALACAAPNGLRAQTPGSIRGTVTDPSAALVPGAAIQITSGGQTRTATSDEQGRYALVLPAGKYSVRADSAGFVTFTRGDIIVSNGQPTTLDIALQISVETQEVSVQEQSAGAVSTDPSSNVGALVLSANDLDALPDDPDDLQNDLQALAGPSAGPNGAQFFVDGFSGGQLPPKSSIREIRVNSNPFSSEFDHPGFGRVEILTRPGADKYHGSTFVNFGDRIFDSKNSFLNGEKPGYTTKMLEGNVGGPLNKRTSFNLEFSRRQINENALVNATGIDSSYNLTNFVGAYPAPNHFWSVNPRIDYAINRNNTLALRYQHNDGNNVNGVGGFNLPTQATKSWNKNNQVQITETAVLGTKAIFESRLQIRDNHSSSNPIAGAAPLGFFGVVSGAGSPQVSVPGAFVTGGAPFHSNYTFDKAYELQELLTLTEGAHTIKAGGRIRQDDLSNKSTANFNGSYSFSLNAALGIPQCLASYTNPTALDLYTETTRLLNNGVSIADVQAQGCGPTQFTKRSGRELQDVRQLDLGLYVQDDWRFRPNLTVSLGLRYETQNNIHDHTDFAPRVALAWAPGSRAGKPSKTVIRGGWGMFYDRFNDNNVLNVLRFDGSPSAQQNYQLTAGPKSPLPAYYPVAPPDSALSNGLQQQVIYSLDSNFKSPSMMQSAISVERSLPGRTSLAVNFIDSRGVHVQRQRNINAPLPGTFNTPANPNGILPYSGLGSIYLYEGSGLYKQTQVMTNVNSRLNSHLQLSGFYAWGKVNSNAGGFPMDQYNTSLDWSRAGYDVRHRAFISGTVGLPFKLTASPFIVMNSGAPFNITTGGNYNGNGLFNARPSFATAASQSIVKTQWGTFNLNPLSSETLIPYNYGEGPGQFSVNVRLARTWGFGERGGSAAGGGGMGGPGGGQMHGPPGGGGGGFGGGMHMPMGMGGTGSTGKKYNVTLSVNARNALNHLNLAQPTGVLTSSTFGQSTNISNGMGGGPFGGGGAGAAGNRRIELQLRFQF